MVPSSSTPKVLSKAWGGRWEGQLAEQQGGLALCSAPYLQFQPAHT